MYELLKQKATEEIHKQTEETKKYILENEWTLNRYLTDLRIKQLKDGVITQAQAIEIATKKLLKEDKKRLENKLQHIEDVAQEIEPTTISINVEWAHNQTWGYNPHATVYAMRYTEGTASGCGYDKESAAIASAFNKNNAMLKILYNLKEKKLQEDYNANNEQACGYGAGYGALPYFEGGVGTNCFTWILQVAGYKHSENHGKHFDSYNFTK